MNFDNFDYPEYDSPMRLIFQKQEEIAKDFANHVDEVTYKAIHNVGVDIDKDKLIQALTQDKKRYEEAYRNGYKAREAELIRCKDCKFNKFSITDRWILCKLTRIPQKNDWFCADGERRSDNG